MKWIVATMTLVAAACTRHDAAPPIISHAYAVPGAGLAPGVLYATIANPSTDADTITSIDVAQTTSAMLHINDTDATGRVSMRMLRVLAIPARGSVTLAPGAVHGMLEGLHGTLARGDSLAVTVHLAHAGPVRGFAHVIDYTDVDSLVTRRR